MSDFQKTNEKIEKAVKGGYKRLEDSVVGGYKKMEDSVVSGYKKVEEKFIETFLVQDGETVEEARTRLKEKGEEK